MQFYSIFRYIIRPPWEIGTSCPDGVTWPKTLHLHLRPMDSYQSPLDKIGNT